MAITSPGLIKAANDALVGISSDINIAKLFAFDMSDEFAEYGDNVKVGVCTATAADVNLEASEGKPLNDYETDSGSVSWVEVKLTNQPKATMKAPKSAEFDAPNAPYWTKCTTAMVDAIDGSISTKLGAAFTAAACTGGKAVLPANFTKNDLTKLRKHCLGRMASTVLALDPDNFADALALLDSSVYGGDEAVRSGVIKGLYGFKAVIQLKDLPSGVTGAIIPADAVAIAARATIKGDAGFIEAGTVMDENGFPITVTRHFSGAKRVEFLNADVLWGVKLVQPAKIKYIAAS